MLNFGKVNADIYIADAKLAPGKECSPCTIYSFKSFAPKLRLNLTTGSTIGLFII